MSDSLRLAKLLEMTTSEHDHEALVAIRKANSLKGDQTWTDLIIANTSTNPQIPKTHYDAIFAAGYDRGKADAELLNTPINPTKQQTKSPPKSKPNRRTAYQASAAAQSAAFSAQSRQSTYTAAQKPYQSASNPPTTIDIYHRSPLWFHLHCIIYANEANYFDSLFSDWERNFVSSWLPRIKITNLSMSDKQFDIWKRLVTKDDMTLIPGISNKTLSDLYNILSAAGNSQQLFHSEIINAMLNNDIPNMTISTRFIYNHVVTHPSTPATSTFFFSPV